MAKANDTDDFEPGITSFDDYSRWQYSWIFGINAVAPDGNSFSGPGEAVHLTYEQKEIIKANITQNVTSLADEHSDVDFYFFLYTI